MFRIICLFFYLLLKQVWAEKQKFLGFEKKTVKILAIILGIILLGAIAGLVVCVVLLVTGNKIKNCL